MTSTVLALLLAAPGGLWEDSKWPPVPERGRDVWAFRSVLDLRPRMVTLALHDRVWAAYDAVNCGLYKVWRGGVKFDGSVYTAAHGPQPTSLGEALAIGKLDEPVWAIEVAGKQAELLPAFRGYTIEKGRIFFTYEFNTKEAGKGWIDEAVEYLPDQGKGEGIFRSLRIRGGKSGLKVHHRIELDASGLTARLNGAPLALKASGSLQTGTVILTQGEVANLEMAFASKAGGSLLASIEPSVPEPQNPPLASNREPGLSMRLYRFKRDVSKIPNLVAGQTANVNKIIPKVDLSTTADFGGFEDQFLVHLTGYLNVSKQGMYRFRMTSDDGSRMSLRDEIIIDHDGLHSAEPLEGQFALSPGEHPIFVEYFEGGADNVLKLEWMTPGSTTWEVIPESAFSTFKGEVRVVAPGVKEILTAGEERRPGDRRPLTDVHPAFDLVTVRPKDFRPKVGGIDFLPDGRLVVCNWEPDGGVYVVSGTEGDARNVSVKRIAFGLAEPLGIKVVDGSIYVLQKQELTRLDDLDGDGVIDRYYAVANGWGVTSNFHEFAFGLVYEKGYFYANLAIAIDPGGKSTQPQNKDRGNVLKIGKNGGWELIARGLRTPNGIGKGPFGQTYITDNQGDWLPSSKVLHLKPGAFYGSRAVNPVGDKDRVEQPPVLWLPQNEIGNSPSEPALLNIAPYTNQLIHGDVTHGGVKRSFIEKVNGGLQGAVFRFSQGLEAGTNRLRWSPDGSLYIGGIGSSGNWGQEGKESFGLQKLTFNGKVPFEMLTMSSRSNGFEVTFTHPIEAGQDVSAAFRMQDWKYVPTVEYGGPKVEPRKLTVKSVTLSRDRKRVFLEVPDLKPGRVVYLHVDPLLQGEGEKMIWQTEAWYTLNEIQTKAGVVAPVSRPQANTLTADEKKQGFKLLFNGKDLEGWTRYGTTTAPGTAWKVEDGQLTFVPGSGTGGDINLPGDYKDFELMIDWKMSPGGNSGIFYRTANDRAASWETGAEYQLLDNQRHPDGKSEFTSAASAYLMKPVKHMYCHPAGEWNQARIRVEGKRVRHWLNGFLVVDYVLESKEWEEHLKTTRFATLKDYGRMPSGKIVLQDHGNVVSFKNIKIKVLDK